MMKSYSLFLIEINRDIPRVWPIESSPLRFLILFLARQRILRFVSPFKFANFSIVFEDNDSLTQALRFVRLASIFSIGGICADRMISSLSLAFNSLSIASQIKYTFFSFSFSHAARASLMEVPLLILNNEWLLFLAKQRKTRSERKYAVAGQA